MPQYDILHDTVKQALIKDGWAITHDPFTITFGLRQAFVDLGAEKMIAAEKEDQTIAVEVKSFVGVSAMTDLERAVGQYAIYKSWLARIDPERILYLAIDSEIFENLFQDISGQVLLDDYEIRVIVVDKEHEEILQWIS